MSVYEDESLPSGSQQRVPKERFDEVNSAAKFYKEQFERAMESLKGANSQSQEDPLDKIELLDDDTKKVLKTKFSNFEQSTSRETQKLQNEIKTLKSMIESLNPELGQREREIEKYQNEYQSKYGHKLPREAALEVILARGIKQKETKSSVGQSQGETEPQKEEQKPDIGHVVNGSAPVQSKVLGRPDPKNPDQMKAFMEALSKIKF